MNKELTTKLWEEHPLLFKGRYSSIKESLIPFGFECGNGWYPIIKELSDKLEVLLEEYVKQHPHGRCYKCGCDYFEHRLMPSGKRICTKVHVLPYSIGPGWSSCFVPQWKRDLVDAWKGKWDQKTPRRERLRKAFKKLLVGDWRYTKYRTKSSFCRKVNRILRILFKLGIRQKLPCKCIEWEHAHPRASQIKEKFGTLRFYMSSGTEEMWKLIHEAEEKSAHTCEDCGAPGKERNDGWIRTLCDECEKKYQERRYG